MKMLKVGVIRSKISGGGTHYTYPLEYQAQKIQILGYESGDESNDIATRGDKDEYCIGVVKDVDAPQFLKSPDITEITRDDAILLGNKWRKQTETITDQNKVISIIAKKMRNEALSQKEIDALDPNKAETGINKSKSFTEMLDGELAK